MKNKRIFLLGATGQIGKELAYEFKKINTTNKSQNKALQLSSKEVANYIALVQKSEGSRALYSKFI